MGSRDPSGVAVAAKVAATVALAVALLLATSLALAGLQLRPDASRADRPADPGLTATPTTLLWTAPVSSASALASDHRLVGTVRRAARDPATAPAGRRHPGSRGTVRTRAQRWFARRNLEGG